MHVGFVVDKAPLGQVFSAVLRFPLPIFIPPISPQSPSPNIRGWFKGPVVATVPKDQQHKIKKIEKIDFVYIFFFFCQSSLLWTTFAENISSR
jgi:hypothetical protein